MQLDQDGYSLESYGRMFDDRVRHDAYVQAMEQSIKPGDVVLDIGTGIGLYALLAAKLGARKVYGVEINPYVRLGRELAALNGLSDRVEFIEALSTKIDLPEKADVILSDMRGVLPFYTQNLPSVRDARERHLAPGGIMMPIGDRIFAALSENPSGVGCYRDRWLDNPFGLDLSKIAVEESAQMRDDRVLEENFISAPVQVAQIDYLSSLTDTGFRYKGSVTATRDGVANGVSAWFEACILEGITYSSLSASVYGMAFYPFPEPIEIEVGAEVALELSAHLMEHDYVWKWAASGVDRYGATWAVDQNSIASRALDLERINRRRASYKVEPTVELVADLLALQLLSKGCTLGEVASELLEVHPEVVQTESLALARVADLAESYGR